MNTRLKTMHYAKSCARAARHGQHGKKPRFGRISAVRFRETRLSCLLSVPAAAVALGVTGRTIQNWETGRSRVPYAAFRLLRILHHYELPDPDWRGYTLHRGTLWSPEGLAFRPEEQRWWSLTCAMAREFRTIMHERRQAVAPSIEPIAAAPALGLVSFFNKSNTTASKPAPQPPFPTPSFHPSPPRRLPRVMAVMP